MKIILVLFLGFSFCSLGANGTITTKKPGICSVGVTVIFPTYVSYKPNSYIGNGTCVLVHTQFDLWIKCVLGPMYVCTTMTTTTATTTTASPTTTFSFSFSNSGCQSGQYFPNSVPPHTAAPTKPCPSPYYYVSGYGCFLRIDGTSTWNASRTACIGTGGDLVTFENLTDSQIRYIGDCTWYYDNFHVGVSGSNSTYTWVTGNVLPSTSALWSPGYPSGNANLTCGSTHDVNTYEVQDTGCTSLFKTVCEIKIY